MSYIKENYSEKIVGGFHWLLVAFLYCLVNSEGWLKIFESYVYCHYAK